MEGRIYDPRAALSKIRNKGRNKNMIQSVTERYPPESETRREITTRYKDMQSETYSVSDSYNEPSDELRKKLNFLEEEKKILLIQNNALQNENEQLRREQENWAQQMEEMKAQYEMEIRELQRRLSSIEGPTEGKINVAPPASKSILGEKAAQNTSCLPYQKFSSSVSPNSSRYNRKGKCDLDLLLSIYKELPTLEKPVVKIDFSQELREAGLI